MTWFSTAGTHISHGMWRATLSGYMGQVLDDRPGKHSWNCPKNNWRIIAQYQKIRGGYDGEGKKHTNY